MKDISKIVNWPAEILELNNAVEAMGRRQRRMAEQVAMLVAFVPGVEVARGQYMSGTDAVLGDTE